MQTHANDESPGPSKTSLPAPSPTDSKADGSTCGPVCVPAAAARSSLGFAHSLLVSLWSGSVILLRATRPFHPLLFCLFSEFFRVALVRFPFVTPP